MNNVKKIISAKKGSIVVFLCCAIFMLVMTGDVWAGVPTVTSVDPNTGITDSTTDVTISGGNFLAGAKVSLLNGALIPAGSYDTDGKSWDVMCQVIMPM